MNFTGLRVKSAGLPYLWPATLPRGRDIVQIGSFYIFCFTPAARYFELETQLLLAKQLQYTSGADSIALLDSVTVVARSLTGLINSLSVQGAAKAS